MGWWFEARPAGEKPPKIVTWETVRTEEWAEVKQRRKAAEINEPSPEKPPAEEAAADHPANAKEGDKASGRSKPTPPVQGKPTVAAKKCDTTKANGLEESGSPARLTGLALSGGGVRSASFSLGFLQALEQSSAFRFIDFLSTVSGGGYAGAVLSSLARKAGCTGTALAGRVTALAQEPDGGQPKEIIKLLNHSQYLNDWRGFLNRYVIGVVLNNLALFSVVLMVATAVAYGWRALDTQWAVDRLLWVTDGWLIDSRRPFLPAVLVLVAWGGWWALSLLRRGTPARARFSGWLLVSGLMFSLVGLAVWCGTVNMNTQNVLAPVFNLNAERTWQRDLIVPLSALILVALIPLLRPKDLIRSGVAPDKPYKRWAFRIVSGALLVGIPFLIVYFLARQNLSGIADDPERPFTAGDVIAWDGFWSRLQAEFEASLKPKSDSNPAPFVSPGSILMARLKKQPVDIRNAAGPSDTKAQGFWEFVNDAEAVATLQYPPLGQTTGWFGTGSLTWARYRHVQEQRDFCANWINEQMNESFVHEVLNQPRIRKHVWEIIGDPGTQPPDRHVPDSEAARLRPLLEAFELKNRDGKDVDAKTLATAWPTDQQGDVAHEAGLLLLRVYYPRDLRPMNYVNRLIVNEVDQWFRFKLLLLWMIGFLVFGGLVSFNHTSMHGFYRRQLEQAFVVPHEDRRTPGRERRTIRLLEMDNTEQGLPYHLLTGACSVPDADLAAADRNLVGFLFSKLYCGYGRLADCNPRTYCETNRYREGYTDLSSAIAISGAAVSPLRTPNLLVRLVMAVTNARLGQWYPHPAVGRVWQPRFVPLIRIIRNSIHILRVRRPRFVFVTDGGHYENLGIEPLLARRCRLIIAADASQDESYRFDDLIRLYRRCEQHGYRFVHLADEDPLSLDDLYPTKVDGKLFCRANFVVGRVLYPEFGRETDPLKQQWGLLVYVKSSLCPPLTADLRAYSDERPDFPHDPTANQFFDADEFYAYLTLGRQIGRKLCARLSIQNWNPNLPPDPDWLATVLQQPPP
jgi:hypothetical protein